MKTILVILIAVLFTGCITQKKCLRKFPPQIITEKEVITEIIYRDTTIYVHIPADTVYAENIIFKTPDGWQTELSVLHAEYAKSSAQVVNGTLKHELLQKESELERVIANAVKEQSTHTTEKVVEVHREKYVPDIFKYSLVLSIVFIGYILFRIFRFRF